MSLGYRHGSPATSPYGYTVKIAHDQHLDTNLTTSEEVINMTVVNGKTKGAAWFVSNCATHSKRMEYVIELKKYFPVDIYGSCGSLKCIRGDDCERMLDYVYHFYLAFENSLCKDYITEKLWNYGYQHNIVPIVLQRSIVEHLVPPHSFIAADDFESPGMMAKYLDSLMRNKTAYVEFFLWKRQYKVVFLHGNNHDVLERPWGLCQICRILWEEPRPKHSIPDFKKFWSDSCEKDGYLVSRLVSRTIETSRKTWNRH